MYRRTDGITALGDETFYLSYWNLLISANIRTNCTLQPTNEAAMTTDWIKKSAHGEVLAIFLCHSFQCRPVGLHGEYRWRQSGTENFESRSANWSVLFARQTEHTRQVAFLLSSTRCAKSQWGGNEQIFFFRKSITVISGMPPERVQTSRKCLDMSTNHFNQHNPLNISGLRINSKKLAEVQEGIV